MKMLGYTTIMLGLALLCSSLLYYFVGIGAALAGAAGGAAMMVFGAMIAMRRKR